MEDKKKKMGPRENFLSIRERWRLDKKDSFKVIKKNGKTKSV